VARRQADEGLTFDSFWTLLRWLDPSPEKAGEAYERIRRRLALRLAWRGCEEAEEVAEEALGRLAARLAKGLEVRAETRDAYLFGIARRVWLEKKRRADRVSMDDEVSLEELVVRADSGPSLRRLYLERCLADLAEPTRDLILRYYSLPMQVEARKSLCRDLRISPNALRIRVHRLSRKLQECVRRQGRIG
jgi:DNA-directed RNA polymerase specialized sigma24 family protein